MNNVCFVLFTSDLSLIDRLKVIGLFFFCPRNILEKYKIDKGWLINKIISIPILLVAWIAKILGLYAVIIIIRYFETYDIFNLITSILFVISLEAIGSLLILADEVWKKEKDAVNRMTIISGVLAFLGLILTFYSYLN